MKRRTIKKLPSSREAPRIFIPHSSWTGITSRSLSTDRLSAEQFWSRLGL